MGCHGNSAGMSQTPGDAQELCAKKICAHFLCPRDRSLLEPLQKGSVAKDPNGLAD